MWAGGWSGYQHLRQLLAVVVLLTSQTVSRPISDVKIYWFELIMSSGLTSKRLVCKLKRILLLEVEICLWYRYLSLTDNWFVFTEHMYNGSNSLKARVGTHCRLSVSTLFHSEGDKRVVLCYHLLPNTTKYMIKNCMGNSDQTLGI
jgi:hypothetical protein